MKAYRILHPCELLGKFGEGKGVTELGGVIPCRVQEIEVDEWRPVSEVPKPEDYDPIGWILVWQPEDKTFYAYQKGDPLPKWASHWKRVTPPECDTIP